MEFKRLNVHKIVTTEAEKEKLLANGFIELDIKKVDKVQEAIKAKPIAPATPTK